MIDFGFCDRRDKAGESDLSSDATANARRQSFAPMRSPRCEFEGGLEPRRLPEHGEAEFERILAGLLRELVHEAFDREDVVVGAYAAPEAGRYRRRFVLHKFDAQV